MKKGTLQLIKLLKLLGDFVVFRDETSLKFLLSK